VNQVAAKFNVFTDKDASIFGRRGMGNEHTTTAVHVVGNDGSEGGSASSLDGRGVSDVSLEGIRQLSAAQPVSSCPGGKGRGSSASSRGGGGRGLISKLRGLFCVPPPRSMERFVAFGAHPVTSAAMEAVFPKPWTDSQAAGKPEATAAAAAYDSAQFLRRAVAGAEAVPDPAELARYSTPPGLLRAALGPAELCTAAGAALAETDAVAEAGRTLARTKAASQVGAGRAGKHRADGGGGGGVLAGNHEDEEDESSALPLRTQPVHLFLCRVAVMAAAGAATSTDDQHGIDDGRECGWNQGRDEDGAGEWAQVGGSGGTGPARYDPVRDAYLAHDPAAVLPEFIITVNVTPTRVNKTGSRPKSSQNRSQTNGKETIRPSGDEFVGEGEKESEEEDDNEEDEREYRMGKLAKEERGGYTRGYTNTAGNQLEEDDDDDDDDDEDEDREGMPVEEDGPTTSGCRPMTVVPVDTSDVAIVKLQSDAALGSIVGRGITGYLYNLFTCVNSSYTV